MDCTFHITDLMTPVMADYALLDTGNGQKLERYGDVVVRRPDPQVLWRPSSPDRWKIADLGYVRTGMSTGRWDKLSQKNIPQRWVVRLDKVKVWVRPTVSKHVGIFPEQYANWQWMSSLVSAERKRTGKQPAVLNLFGYTGVASLFLASSGAMVTHVDSSKTAVNWLKENAILTGLGEKAIRLIVDDAFAFVVREARRGKRYDAVVMDPPAFGRGPSGELWEIERQFLDLVDSTISLLTDSPLFYLVNGYAAGYSAIAYKNNIEHLGCIYGGSIEYGELTIAQEEGKKRVLPAGIYARWAAKR